MLSASPPSRLIGLTSALLVACIWTGFMLMSRLAASQTMTVFDLAAVRYGLAGLLMAPFVVRWWPRHLAWWQVLVMASGAGVPYVLLSYGGFTLSSAAAGGVFMNGSLPLFSVIVSGLWEKTRPPAAMLAGISVIIAGCAMTALGQAGGPGFSASSQAWTGYAMFAASSVLLALYMSATRIWQVTARELLAIIPVTNALLYLPVWWALLPSNLSQAPLAEVFTQAAYHAIGPSIAAVALLTLAVYHLGTARTAAIMAAVPGAVAVGAYFLLAEPLSGLALAGLALVTAGILLTVLVRSKAVAIKPCTSRPGPAG